jgi:hypothetical protein
MAPLLARIAQELVDPAATMVILQVANAIMAGSEARDRVRVLEPDEAKG